MRTIAVILHSLLVEYSVQILEGITSYYKDKNIRTLIFQTNDPHSVYGVYDYQNWVGTEFLKSEEIDGILIITGSFAMTVTPEFFKQTFKNINKPVISISTKLGLNNETTTIINCDKIYDEIVRHFVTEHNCKKIAFITADIEKSKEAEQRFVAYKKALITNGLEYDESLVLHGNFTADSGYNAVSKVVKSKEDLFFDALINSNDFMAVGALSALQDAGINVPEDVKLIGFDNTSHSYLCNPKFSTIDQNIFKQGQVAAKALLDILEEKKVPEVIHISPSVLYRQSCGCIDLNDHRQIYKNQHGELIEEENIKKIGLQADEKSMYITSKLEQISAIVDVTKATHSLQELFYVMKYCLKDAEFSKALVYFYSQAKTVKKYDKFNLPSKVSLNMFIDLEKNIEVFSPDVSINPNKQLFSQEFLENEPGTYIFQPIFSAEKNYGFMLCKITSKYFTLYPLYLKLLISATSYSYEYTQLLLNNSNLSLQSKTDDLTKVLNRRGFEDLGQKSIDIALEMDNEGMIFFIDMDGLKKINDTYGHSMGDKAIQAQAQVLKKALRSNDVIGRVGGDEFVAITIGMKPESLPKIRTKIEKLNETISEKKGLPFTLSCSIGAIPFCKKNKDLSSLILKADSLLYEEKQMKKNNQK